MGHFECHLNQRFWRSKKVVQVVQIGGPGRGVGGGAHRALDGGQFRFWSNLKVPFYVYLWHRSVI